MNQKRLVRVAGILVVCLVMGIYGMASYLEVQGYIPLWKGLNASQMSNCNQTTWNYIVEKTAYVFSKQWVSPFANVSGVIYPTCSQYTGALRNYTNYTKSHSLNSSNPLQIGDGK